MLLAALLAVQLQAPTAPPTPAGEEPRAVVRGALRAVERDSAAALAAAWDARLRRDPGDRAAALGRATLARLTYDYADADRRLRALAAAGDRWSAYALLGLGQSLDTRGDFPGAVDALARARAAARRVNDRAAEGEALVGLSLPRASLERVEVGLALLDSAERLLPAAADLVDARAELLRRRAVLLAVAGRYDDAARVAALCTRIARQAGELRAEGQCLRSAALAHKLRGAPDSALAVLGEAERVLRRARDRSVLAETLLRRGDALREVGAYAEAKAAALAARAEGEASRNLLAVGAAGTALGSIALRLGDHAAADEALRAAAAAFEAQGDSMDLTYARSFRALVHLAADDLAEARALARACLEWYVRTGDWSEALEGWRLIAGIETRARDLPAAARALDSARAVARRHGTPEWLADLELDAGRLALRQGDPARAAAHFGAYLRAADTTRHLDLYTARTYLAEALARGGDLARAEREITAAGTDFDRWRARLTDRELRLLAFQANPSDHTARGAGIASVLGALATHGRAEAAFALAERRRAREMRDRLELAASMRSGADAAPAAAALTGAGAATAAAVAAALPDARTAVVEYVAGADGAPTTAFVVTRAPDGSAVVHAAALAPADTLAPRVARFVSLLESGDAPAALARQLGAALLDDAVAALPASVDRLVIVPDGPLHRLPFDALRLADGRWAVERFSIAISPSAAVAAAAWRAARAQRASPAAGAARIVAFGDPAFAHEESEGSDDAGELAPAAPNPDGPLPRLLGSGAEAAAVARYAADAAVLTRGAASEAALKRLGSAGGAGARAAGRVSVLHLATHAFVDERSVARTALALAPGGGEDGVVTPGELAALRLGADLVVLSACRTAGGVVVAGEGVQGLTAPLLEAGARAVVATGWRIGDRSAAALVERFYGELARGLPVGEALRAVKLDALRRGRPPREWAAFSVVGDASLVVPLRAPAWYTRHSALTALAEWRSAVAAAVLAVAAAGALLRRRRARRPSIPASVPGD